MSARAGGAGRARKGTSTANFGSGRREGHDASGFYARFVPPEISPDDTVARPVALDTIYEHDARDMSAVAAGSVALVVTSPPYFAGKQYEEDLSKEGVPSDYLEYLELLHEVFAECKRVLEPGGRIAVNVANLGRRPYRSLAADVTGILEDLGLLLRGEVVWWKGRAAGGSCAWGSFQRPKNPVLRDVTERVVIASKGRFDRAIEPEARLALGLPSVATVSKDEFMDATTDLWELAPESATRVGHPAPFPVELPSRLISLYTYEGDLVLDPFMGSGSTAVAAVRTGRHYVGYDLDPEYIATAHARVDTERARVIERVEAGTAAPVALPAKGVEVPALDPVAAALRAGEKAKDVAAALLDACGFTITASDVRPRGLGITFTFAAADQTGGEWYVDVAGGFTTGSGGLRRADALWRVIGKASVLAAAADPPPLLVLTTEAPAKGTPGRQSLRAVVGPERSIVDVVEMLDVAGHERLHGYALKGRPES